MEKKATSVPDISAEQIRSKNNTRKCIVVSQSTETKKVKYGSGSGSKIQNLIRLEW